MQHRGGSCQLQCKHNSLICQAHTHRLVLLRLCTLIDPRAAILRIVIALLTMQCHTECCAMALVAWSNSQAGLLRNLLTTACYAVLFKGNAICDFSIETQSKQMRAEHQARACFGRLGDNRH